MDIWRNAMPYNIMIYADGRMTIFNREYEVIYGERVPVAVPTVDVFLYDDGSTPWSSKKMRLRYLRKLNEIVPNLRFPITT
jgi:hypothetical protein